MRGETQHQTEGVHGGSQRGKRVLRVVEGSAAVPDGADAGARSCGAARTCFPTRPPSCTATRRYTYRQLEERANRLASGLRALGPAASRPRGVHPARTRRPCWRRTSACPRPGLVLVPINTRLSSDEIGYILKHSGATVRCFVDHELEPLVKPLDLTGMTRDPRRRHRRARRSLRGLPRRGVARAGEPWLEDEYETISINYTSGTTGRPKGVMSTTAAPTSTPSARSIETGHDVRRDVSLDAADVPLQRLVLHVGRDRRRRHPRLPAPGRAGAHLGAHRPARASPTSAARRRC